MVLVVLIHLEPIEVRNYLLSILIYDQCNFVFVLFLLTKLLTRFTFVYMNNRTVRYYEHNLNPIGSPNNQPNRETHYRHRP